MPLYINFYTTLLKILKVLPLTATVFFSSVYLLGAKLLGFYYFA